MTAEAPLSSLEAWRHIIAQGLRWGLGDVEIEQEIAVYTHGDVGVRPPAVSLYPGGLDNTYVTQAPDEEATTMCRFRAKWTAHMWVGKPYAVEAYDTLDLWVGRLDRSMQRCAADPRNESGEVPTLGDVTAPFKVPIGKSDQELLVAAVEISISYEPQEK